MIPAAHYRCQNCAHEFTCAPGPVECQMCKAVCKCRFDPYRKERDKYLHNGTITPACDSHNRLDWLNYEKDFDK